MKRRDFMKSILPACTSAEILSLETGEKPLAISVKVNGRLDAQQRLKVGEHMQRNCPESLKKLPIIVSDDVAEFKIITDREVSNDTA